MRDDLANEAPTPARSVNLLAFSALHAAIVGALIALAELTRLLSPWIPAVVYGLGILACVGYALLYYLETRGRALASAEDEEELVEVARDRLRADRDSARILIAALVTSLLALVVLFGLFAREHALLSPSAFDVGTRATRVRGIAFALDNVLGALPVNAQVVFGIHLSGWRPRSIAAKTFAVAFRLAFDAIILRAILQVSRQRREAEARSVKLAEREAGASVR